jgi:hypothetical protein
MKKKSCPPIIVIGMHRSGTGMVAGILEELGVFMGWKQQQNNEALFFLDYNEWLLNQCGATWDRLESLAGLENNKEIHSLLVDFTADILAKPRIVHFLGPWKYLRYRSLFNLSMKWGWKDPRNTLTLPVWLDIFPTAKVIHIYRHGVDVAASLKTRHDKRMEKEMSGFTRSRPLYWLNLRSIRHRLAGSLRCATLMGGFSLWEEYMQRARGYVQALDDRALEFRYEAFLADPARSIRTLAEFCEIRTTEVVAGKIENSVNKKRAFAYKENPQSAAFAERVADRLKIFGY